MVEFEIPQAVMTGRTVNVTDHTRGLTSLSSNIRTLSAKMALLKSEMTASLANLPESSRNTIFETYDSIGQDLHVLLTDWSSGRTDLLRLFPTQSDDDTLADEVEGSVTDSGFGTSVAETYDPLNKRISCGDWGINTPRVNSPISADELADIDEEAGIFEGTARGRMNSGVLSRADRIERARREREEALERKRIAVEQNRWVNELKDVLVRRNR